MAEPLLPLNGIRTHPLKTASLAILRELRSAPLPRQAINPGVVNRLLREGLVEEVPIKNPYRTKADTVRGIDLTPAGIVRAENSDA